LDENIKTHPEEMSWTAYALVNKVINLLVSWEAKNYPSTRLTPSVFRRNLLCGVHNLKISNLVHFVLWCQVEICKTFHTRSP
jgi:hypothetical protein